MAINGFPNAIQNVIEQQNYLETKLRKSLHAKLVLRKAAEANLANNWFEGRIGETKTFTRSNPIAPLIIPLNPAANSGLDNGVTPVNRGFEQWQATLNEYPNAINLNLLGNETLLGDLYIDNMEEMAAAAANSMETLCVQKAMNAYCDFGDTFVTAAVTGTTIHVDNAYGFQTQYQSSVAPSYGLPAAVSATNKLPVLLLNGSTGAVKGNANVTGVALDTVNTSYMQVGTIAFGFSGNLTLDTSETLAAGDRVVSMDVTNPSTTAFNPVYKDGSAIVRPLVSGTPIQTAYQMTTSNIVAPTAIIPQMVALLARRQVPRLPNGLYGCAIDSTVLAQFYQDQGFQYATMGSYDRSPIFENGIIAKGWGVEFVEATQVPAFTAPAGGFMLRHAFVFGADVISEHPFAGARTAASRAAEIGDLIDTRWVDRVQFITQSPLDRLMQVVKLSYNYVGDFEPGTDKGSNPNIVFTSDFCRFKRGVFGQFAAPF